VRRRIHLHGAFAAFHDGPIEVIADTVAEAIEGISRQIPGFQPNLETGRVSAQVAGFPTKASLYAPTDVVDIHLFPALVFGKNGGLIQCIIGSILIIVAVVLAPFTMGLSLSLFPTGVGMIIGAIVQALMPQPHTTPEHRSKYLSNTQNTVRIGTPIPVLYGERRCAGQILSLIVQSQVGT
jgi:predicted phage tail protein